MLNVSPHRPAAAPLRPRRVVPAGGDLVHEGEPAPHAVWVAEGWVALKKSLGDGRVQTVDIALPGDLVEPRAGDGATAWCALHALTRCALAVLGPNDLEQAASPAGPGTPSRAALAEAARARQAERMLRLGQGNAVMGVAYALIEFHLRLGGAGLAPGGLRLPMTQREIGDYVGLSAVHVCRTLRRLRRAGLIAMPDPARVLFTDLEGLARLADADIARLAALILPKGAPGQAASAVPAQPRPGDGLAWAALSNRAPETPQARCAPRS